jgi:hypothetical protein
MTPHLNLTTQLMQEHIILPGAPQVVCSRAWAYQWLQRCGYSGHALTQMIFAASEVTRPCASREAVQPFLDAVEAELTGCVLVWAVGKIHLPRLTGVAHYAIPLAQLRSFTRPAIDLWLAHADEYFHSIRDWAATAPSGARLPWLTEDGEQCYLDSLDSLGQSRTNGLVL